MSAKSVGVATGASKGLGQATARRQSFFERWPPAHNLTLEDGVRSGNQPLWKPEEFADLTGLSRVLRSEVDDRRFGAYGRR